MHKIVHRAAHKTGVDIRKEYFIGIEQTHRIGIFLLYNMVFAEVVRGESVNSFHNPFDSRWRSMNCLAIVYEIYKTACFQFDVSFV